MKISWTASKVYSGHDFHRKNFKGPLFHKNIGGVIVLVLCTSSDNGLYLYQVSRKYLEPYQSYGEDTKS